MALQELSEYKAITDASQEVVICAAKLSDAALQIEGAYPTAKVIQVSRIRESVEVDVPLANVLFQIQVSPDGAAAAGCIAAPSSFIVQPGDKVIAQAIIPSGAGFTFTGWYRGTSQLSAALIAELTIAAPADGAISDVITAKFTAV
jgi:hypothetical protein